MKAILCADQNWGIGNNGKLLVSIPADLRFFQEQTMGHVVVMGRKTYESLPQKEALRGRINIVLTKNENFRPKGVTVVHAMPELAAELKKYDSNNIFVIGGGQIYELLLPYCDTIYVTKVDMAYRADTWFVNLDVLPEWEMTEESEEQTCYDIEYTFRTYQRKYHTALPDEENHVI